MALLLAKRHKIKIMETQAKYFHAFNLINGCGPISFKKLLIYFKSLEKAWLAPLAELKQADLPGNLADSIEKNRPKINPDKELEKISKQGIDVVTILDNSYPKLLKEIYNPPALLYIKGRLQETDEFSLGIVGTRRPSAYGQQVTPLITADLAQSGLTIVSGLAKGIDTLAHEAALQAGGRTIAVLGCGLNNIYPASNKELAQAISQQGAVLSEFPPDTMPLPQYFPLRNRIVAGLSLGTLVIEAPTRSGALITAQQALEQNREIFAVPGTIFSINSSGTNNLIKLGAKLVNHANDILEELNLNLITDSQPNQQIKPDNQTEALILEHLSYEPLHVDKIIIQTKLLPSAINSTLSLMEVKGKVKNLGNNSYVLGR